MIFRLLTHASSSHAFRVLVFGTEGRIVESIGRAGI